MSDQTTDQLLGDTTEVVDQLLDDDGHIDQKKVTAATQAAITDLGLARKLSNHVPREGGNPRPGGGDRFTEAFSPR